MKTLEQYLDEAAVKNGYKSIDQIYSVNPVGIHSIIKQAMQRAIEDACKEQKELCANEAQAWKNDCYDGGSHCGHPEVDKDSILSAPSPLKQ